ncbi:MAG: STT3 domain-containing protein [Candidatus Diapherotrites archaeon]
MGEDGILGRIKSALKKTGKRELFLVFLIFLLGLSIRGHLMRYDLMFEFDSYYHARMASYVIQDFSIPTHDPLAYYQIDGGPMPKTGAFFWAFTAIIYKVFTLGAAYNKELWISFVKLLPALFGALTALAMYFLGKNMYGRRAGAAMGIFAAVVPAFVYRTMAGFFEDDCLGFLWLIIGFVFFVRAIKGMEFNRESIINAAIAAFFFGLMAWTWEMFLLIPLVLVGYFGITITILWFRNAGKEKIISFVKIFAIAFLLFSAFAIAVQGTGWIDRAFDYVRNYIPVTAQNIDRAQSKGSDVLAQTVGEENLGLQFFGTKYNALIIFPLLAFLLIPWKLYRDKKEHLSIIIFVWAAITLYMAASKLKFTYTLGLPIAACGGFVFNEIMIFLGGRTQFEKMAVAAALGFMLLLGIGSATYFMTQNPPNIEIMTGWKDTLYWMQKNTPEGSKFLNWWDEGHWITFIGERGASADNRNIDGEANADMAKFVIAEDENTAYSIVSGRYKADYVILSSDLLDKQISLVMYAYDTTNFSDPRFKNYFGVVMPCGKSTDPLGGSVTYDCGSNKIPAAEMNALPTQWTDKPRPIAKDMAGFIYREEDNSIIFILNEATNNTFIAKLWANDPTIRHFKEVYTNSGQVKIFKVVP